MTVVRPFAAEILDMVGVKVGKRSQVETFTQPTYQTVDGTTLRPDGLIRVSRGANIQFEALVEVKTGPSKLQADQLTGYMHTAKTNGVNTVITISNEIEPSPGVHPTDGIRAGTKTAPHIHHVSWATIVATAIKEQHHSLVEDPEQAWILNELIRYLTHKKSGVVEFTDMGASWVAVRDGALEDRLSKTDPKVADVCRRWDQLLSVVALRLSVDTGTEATEVTPKAHREKPRLRSKAFIDKLCDAGTLTGEIRVPDAAGDIDIEVNLHAQRTTLSTQLKAPDDRTPRVRVVWLIKQLKHAPDSLLIDAYPKATKNPVTASLGELREDPTACIGTAKKPPSRFNLRLHSEMGAGRVTKRKLGFIDSVTEATVAYYAEVLQHLRTFVPKAPPITPKRASPDEIPPSTQAAQDTEPPAPFRPEGSLSGDPEPG